MTRRAAAFSLRQFKPYMLAVIMCLTAWLVSNLNTKEDTKQVQRVPSIGEKTMTETRGNTMKTIHATSMEINPVEYRRKQMSYQEIEAHLDRHYMQHFGVKINWTNPLTYNEKVQVSKLYMTSDLKTRLTDKLAVRDWVSHRIGSQYLIPLLGVYESFESIDFESLPNKFVIKCNHDCGSVTICSNKRQLDQTALKQKYGRLLKQNFAYRGFEMQYKDIKPRILIEQFLGSDINDYKFMCFNGTVHYYWIDFDRFSHHSRIIYDSSGTRQQFSIDFPTNLEQVSPPKEIGKMMEVAEQLSRGFPHVRVDLYLIMNKIYFGEMTFSTSDGMNVFNPPEWNLIFGKLWPFDNTVREQILAQRIRP